MLHLCWMPLAVTQRGPCPVVCRRQPLRQSASLTPHPSSLPTSPVARTQTQRLGSTQRRGWTPLSASAAAQQVSDLPSAPAGGPQLVWFKHDLRIDDHPGLHEALAAGAAVIPVFCFDPDRYGQLVHSPASAKALFRAVQSLQGALRALGSDLLILTGPWEEELPALAQRTGAAALVCEDEIETAWRSGMSAVASALPQGVEVKKWIAPLFSVAADTFKAWKECNADGPAAPLNAPAALPPLPEELGSLAGGELPPPDEILRLVAASHAAHMDPRLAGADALEAAMGVPAWARTDSDEDSSSAAQMQAASRLIEGVGLEEEETAESGNGPSNSGRMSGSTWEAELAAELAAGEGSVLQALRSYVRHLETSADGGSSALQWQLGPIIAQFDVPATPDGCFPALFNRALALGVVSRRRVYAEAAELLGQPSDWQPPAGLLHKLGWLLTSGGGASARRWRQRKAAAAAFAMEAGDFHAAMAGEREGKEVHGARLHHWRWRGILTDFLVAKAEAPLPGAPAVLLVHGFGAFGEHWRDNVAALAAQGFDVYGPTFPGYGRAEKPAVPYGQDLWRDFLADFVLEVVRRPVVVAGNSIGGFIAASLAADVPGAVAGLVLVNSAGLLNEGYAPPAIPPPPPSPPQFVAQAISSALFAFLEGDVAKQLARVYPTNPARADAWLAYEITRAAGDPGALGVFRSVFYLPKPRALNYLVSDKFGGPTLVLQGAHDPLNDAVKRAQELDRLCPNLRVVMLNAGHCPHDEVPGEFNAALAEFVKGDVIGAGTERREPAAAAGSA